MTHLMVNEIYASIQGEAYYSGWPCIFLRLTGCPLRCNWCDTVHGFHGGEEKSLDEIQSKIESYNIPRVLFTGGEPLFQKHTIPLMEKIIQETRIKILLETSGSICIKKVPQDVHIIMDIKCPDSKMASYNKEENINYLKNSDEVKFVVASPNDLKWAKDFITSTELNKKANILISPAWGLIEAKKIASWLIEENLDYKLNLQIHKYIWSPRQKKV